MKWNTLIDFTVFYIVVPLFKEIDLWKNNLKLEYTSCDMKAFKIYSSNIFKKNV